MRDDGGALNAWKERGLFAVTGAALVAYVLWFSLAGPSGGVVSGRSGLVGPAGALEGGRDSNDDDNRDQRYVRAPGGAALPRDAGEVFARPENDAYFDGALRRVWVEPRVEEVRAILRLGAPPPVVPVPPMLLPVPGPALHATAGLPRWPATPVQFVEEEEKETAAGKGESAGPDEKPPGVRPSDARPRPETPRGARPRDRRPRDEKTRDEKRRDEEAREGRTRDERPRRGKRRRRPPEERDEGD